MWVTPSSIPMAMNSGSSYRALCHIQITKPAKWIATLTVATPIVMPSAACRYERVGMGALRLGRQVLSRNDERQTAAAPGHSERHGTGSEKETVSMPKGQPTDAARTQPGAHF